MNVKTRRPKAGGRYVRAVNSCSASQRCVRARAVVFQAAGSVSGSWFLRVVLGLLEQTSSSSEKFRLSRSAAGYQQGFYLVEEMEEYADARDHHKYDEDITELAFSSKKSTEASKEGTDRFLPNVSVPRYLGRRRLAALFKVHIKHYPQYTRPRHSRSGML